MAILLLILVSLFGLIVGSFLSAYTYRWPKGIAISKGRSFCPKCKEKISWYDNVPLFSYLLLGGRCRKCGKKISLRYPLIELSTSIAFILIVLFLGSCATSLQGQSFKGEALCVWGGYLGHWALPYLLLVVGILIAVFIIDLENQLIPDGLVYFMFLLTTTLLILFSPQELFLRLLSGFSASTFLLLIHLLTLGRGMGLGDVKFALFGGLFLGWPFSGLWLFLSFVIGAGVGVILILLGKASLGQKIAFGPFLALSLFITILWGNSIYYLLIP